MNGVTVSATFKGEHVFLDRKVFPRQTLLTLHATPRAHSRTVAGQIAAAAARDETLTNISIELSQNGDTR